MKSIPDINLRKSKIAGEYQTALRAFLKKRLRSDPTQAKELGVAALQAGLEILDMARVHDFAMEELDGDELSPAAKKIKIKRSRLFFSAAILPMEGNHQLAKEQVAHAKEFSVALKVRTRELADSIKTLKGEVFRRKKAEISLKRSLKASKEHLEKSRHLQVELRELSHLLLNAQEEERMKISRELHDVIAQTLTGINVNLDILKKQSSANPKQLRQKIRNTQRLVEKSVDIVHRFACELRPTVLDDLGLIPALKSFLKSTKAESGLQLSLSISAAIEKSSSVIRTALYRVVQEAVTNVCRHARASHVSIQIHCRKSRINMAISDNGQGMEMQDILGTKMTARLGLLGMRERIEMVGGKFTMESVKGESTTIRVEIPL